MARQEIISLYLSSGSREMGATRALVLLSAIASGGRVLQSVYGFQSTGALAEKKRLNKIAQAGLRARASRRAAALATERDWRRSCLRRRRRRARRRCGAGDCGGGIGPVGRAESQRCAGAFSRIPRGPRVGQGPQRPQDAAGRRTLECPIN